MRWVLALLALSACSGSNGGDAGADAGPEPVDLAFSADPDPSERTDCASTPPATGEARAKHVACPEELVQGSLAMGRVGDIVLENARARFIVRTGAEAASTIGGPAGGVIDAAPHGGVDLLKEIFPLFGFVSITPSAIEVVDAGGDGEARVRVLFEDAPLGLVESVFPGLANRVDLRGQLDYVLRADEDVLRLEMDLTPAAGDPQSSAQLGFIALLGGQELWQPVSGLLTDERFGGDGPVVVVGERPEGALAVSLLAEGSLTHIQTIQLMWTPRTVVRRGELTRIEGRVAVASTAAEALRAARPSEEPLLTIEGAPGERVEITDAAGAMYLRSSFDAAGRAAVHLPAGTYTARAGIRGLFEGAPVSITHPSAPLALDPAPGGTLVIAATDATIPVRVTVERAGEELERFVARGETSRRFPPGDYTITVSHGLEHDAVTTDVTIAEGATLRLEPDLPRAIDTDGWVSVDLHLHSDLSTDSVHAVEDAIRLLAAEGVQAAAATDHDFITDYAAVAARAAVDDLLVVVPGVEVSTTRYGHIGGYPLLPDPDRAGFGAPVWYELTPSEVFERLRELGDASIGGALVQINHPRLGDASFFGSVELDLATGMATADPTSLGLPADTDLNDFGFDVLEVWNGYTRGGNEASFEDYLALFAAGRRFTMVGNSDSHLPTRPPGSPRTFVQVPDESAFAWEDVATSLRARRATVAAGIFVTAELAGPRAGDSVPVSVRVQAPPWARTSMLRIYAGRTIALERALDPGVTDPVRLEEVIDVPLGGADFVVVRADGDAAPDPIQHFEPIGVTNPLIVP
jgi:hypothetical protein